MVVPPCLGGLLFLFTFSRRRVFAKEGTFSAFICIDTLQGWSVLLELRASVWLNQKTKILLKAQRLCSVGV